MFSTRFSSRLFPVAVAITLLGITGCTSQAQPITSLANGSATAALGVNVSRVPQGGLVPQLVARDGILHLIYFQGEARGGDIFYLNSRDDGRNWSAPLRVNSQSGSAVAMGTIRGPQLGIGREGRAFVVWNGSDKARPRNAFAPNSEQKYGAAPLLFTRLDDAGTAFEPQRNLMTRTFNLDGGAGVACDETGRVYVAWHANTAAGQDEGARQVFLSTSSDDGRSFAPERAVWDAPTGACGCCQLRVMAQGQQVALLYRSAREMVNRDTYYLLSNDGARTFTGTKVQNWEIAACPMSSFSLAQRGAQTLGAWESEKRVHFAPLTANAAPTRITDAAPGDNQKYPTLAANASGQTLLAWTEGTRWARGGQLKWQIYDASGAAVAGASGQREGVPAWSFPAAFVRADGSFGLLF